MGIRVGALGRVAGDCKRWLLAALAGGVRQWARGRLAKVRFRVAGAAELGAGVDADADGIAEPRPVVRVSRELLRPEREPRLWAVLIHELAHVLGAEHVYGCRARGHIMAVGGQGARVRISTWRQECLQNAFKARWARFAAKAIARPR